MAKSKFRGIENKPMFEAHVARSLSGAAGMHGSAMSRKAVLGSKRQSTRLAASKRAIRDQMA